MLVARETPNIWITWLTKLLVGENSCEWSGWSKAHYQRYDKVPGGFDPTAWQIAVFTENQNSLTLRGASAAPGGKPDLSLRVVKSNRRYWTWNRTTT